MDSFSELCNPAKIYLVLAAFSMIIMIFGKQYGPAVAKFIFALIFTYFLNWLCGKGYQGVSWFIVLIPFVLIGIAAVLFVLTATKAAVAQRLPSQVPPSQVPPSQVPLPKH